MAQNGVHEQAIQKGLTSAIKLAKRNASSIYDEWEADWERNNYDGGKIHKSVGEPSLTIVKSVNFAPDQTPVATINDQEIVMTIKPGNLGFFEGPMFIQQQLIETVAAAANIPKHFAAGCWEYIRMESQNGNKHSLTITGEELMFREYLETNTRSDFIFMHRRNGTGPRVGVFTQLTKADLDGRFGWENTTSAVAADIPFRQVAASGTSEVIETELTPLLFSYRRVVGAGLDPNDFIKFTFKYSSKAVATAADLTAASSTVTGVLALVPSSFKLVGLYKASGNDALTSIRNAYKGDDYHVTYLNLKKIEKTGQTVTAGASYDLPLTPFKGQVGLIMLAVRGAGGANVKYLSPNDFDSTTTVTGSAAWLGAPKTTFNSLGAATTVQILNATDEGLLDAKSAVSASTLLRQFHLWCGEEYNVYDHSTDEFRYGCLPIVFGGNKRSVMEGNFAGNSFFPLTGDEKIRIVSENTITNCTVTAFLWTISFNEVKNGEISEPQIY
jgi:hypothetical protein